MKKNVITLAITCICAVSALLFQSCVREEDYDQAIIGDWELTSVTESGEVHSYTHYDEQGNRVNGESLGNYEIVASEFSEPCRISFKSDGTFTMTSNGDIVTSSYYKYEILADDIKFSEGQWKSHTYRFERSGYRDTIVNGKDFRYYFDGDWTIERMTRNKLILKRDGVRGQYGVGGQYIYSDTKQVTMELKKI